MDRASIKRIGKDNVRKQWGELLLALVLVEVAGTVAALISLGLGSLIVSGPLDFGLTYLYYKQTQGEQPGQKMLLEGFKQKFGDSFLAGLLVGLIAAIPTVLGIIIGFGKLIRTFTMMRYSYYGYYGDYTTGFSFGSLLLTIIEIALVVACVYITYAICMSMYILVRETDKTAVGAIKKSWAMTKGHKGRLFVFDLSFIGWGILCCLTFGILLIWVAPYYRSARTVLFNDIYDHSHVADNPDFSFRNEFNDIKNMAGNIKMPGQQAQTVAPEAAPAPEATAAPAPGMKFCKHCGAQISESAVFCNKCGGQQ